ncbi:MAG: hypothetical protein V2B20_24050, partial [Pseudomonadota bacterium]
MSKELTFRGDKGEHLHAGETVHLGGRHFAHDKHSPCYEDDSCIVVLEGEIYNDKALREKFDLEKNASGGKIVTAAYGKHGQDFANGLNGIFAIAIYDKKTGQILLTRDHVGSKSLFYVKNSKGIFFATTIKALLRTGLVNANLSINAIHSYFSSTSISPPNTMFSDIRCLRPGT